MIRKILKFFQPDKPPVVLTANAYRRETDYCLHSHGRLPGGFSIACEPFVVLPRNVSARQLAEALLAVLSQSGKSLDEIKDYQAHWKSLIKASGARSNRAFCAGADLCNIGIESTDIVFQPNENELTGSFVAWKTHLPVRISEDSISEDIGETLIRAFDLCTTKRRSK